MRNPVHRARRRKFCGNKKSYLTREDACCDMGLLAKTREAIPGEYMLNVYTCKHCGGFHVGHTPKKVRERFGL